ncbi:Armadillo repeat-containing protein 4 [Phlyctochytrium bullatum]|nr:Armadillo repeat-containing protein 4 [Phlyctochytrium bullatum]
MGAALSSLLQWGGDLQIGQAQADKASLQTSLVNQSLLHELVHIIEALAVQHPVESKAEFKRPLQWQTTSLRPSHFSAQNSAQLWNVVPFGQKNHKAMVTSVATKSDGQPFFSLEQVTPAGSDAGAMFVARVSSVEYLHRVLHIAEEMKLRELQDILQANPDPIGAIFGTSGTSQATILVEAFDACNNETDPKRKDQNVKLYKLLLVLNSFDLDLLSQAVKSQAKEKLLDIYKVSTELQMLQAFCGKDQKYALLSIGWESDYIFSNGCRAPPWRQVYGEISYIEVECFDVDRFIVTASKNGYFINKGYSTDEKGNERLNYEKVSELYPTLVDLIKSQSKHFEACIDKQDYMYQPDESLEITNSLAVPQTEASGAADSKEEDLSEGDQDDEVNQTSQSRHRDVKRSTNAKKKSKSTSKARNVTEPSLKWRSLGMTLEEAKNQRKKRYGARSASEKRTGGGGRQDSPARGRKGGTGGGRSPSLDCEDISDSDAEISSEEEVQEKRQENNELPAEYYSIQKLVKYLRCGNQTATIIAICSLRDFDLSNEFNQIAIRDVGGLDTLVNLLDTDNPKCKNGALKILKEISQNVQIRSYIADLDGMQPLVELLRDPDEEIKCLAAETIAHCAKNARNRRAVRRYGGIRKLVRLLKSKSVNKEERVAISGALALATCSKSAKNKEAIQLAGAIPLLANLLESQNESLLIPVVGILQECASDDNYRVAIRASGMIRFLVENLASKNEELQTHCASAIFKCAEEDETRALVRIYNGLTPLVNLLDNPSNKELLVAATGAVWKCAQNLDNVAAFNKLNTIKKLVSLMDNQPEDVLVNVVGALGACAQTPDGRTSIRESGGITPLVNLLTGTNQALLVNVTTAVGACALDSDCMAIIDRLDGVRLLWSLLKSANPQVQASAAWAISPCIEHAKDAGEMVRSFVGGLELIVSLLKSDNTEVLASVCAAIANIAKDEENLAVITDHGVVPMLAKLTNTRNDKLRKHLAEAIARCCHWGNNRVAFGTASAVAPLVKYLRSPDEEVHRSTARALHQLSMDPDNCITMHEHGVVQLLLGMVGSADSALQEAAAGTIGNIRRYCWTRKRCLTFKRLALASEKASMC